MAEMILNPPRPEAERTRPKRNLHIPQATRDILDGVAHPHFLERRSRMGPVVFLISAFSLSAAVLLGTTYQPSYAVTVDGVALGPVAQREAVYAAVNRVEARASAILGYDYSLKQEIAYTFELTKPENFTQVSQIETYLFNHIGEVMKTSVLTVNGEMVGAADDAAILNGVLERVKNQYTTENTRSVEFIEPVVITREYTPTNALRSTEQLFAALTKNETEQRDYVIQPGDTFWDIAWDNHLNVSELQAMNPDIDIEKLMVGQTLKLDSAVPFLSVRTVDVETFDKSIPFETEEVEDENLYVDQTEVRTEGVEGRAECQAQVTYLNGNQEDWVLLSETVVQEPVNKVIAKGTKEYPEPEPEPVVEETTTKTKASTRSTNADQTEQVRAQSPVGRASSTGSFQWPVYGRITSNYGYRNLFGSGSFHSGLDIASPYGTSIAAADGGVVTFSGMGTGSSWSYGNYVVIDHGNGLQTLYAHCSSLCVRAGQRVSKGQTIAKVGSTGRSTGNHCHFTVKVNGSTVNPLNYLP